jgi:hypothetical protein
LERVKHQGSALFQALKIGAPVCRSNQTVVFVFGFVFFDLSLFFERVLWLFFIFFLAFVLFSFVAHVHSSECWMVYPMLKIRYGVCMTAPGVGIAGADPSNAVKSTANR